MKNLLWLQRSHLKDLVHIMFPNFVIVLLSVGVSVYIIFQPFISNVFNMGTIARMHYRGPLSCKLSIWRQ